MITTRAIKPGEIILTDTPLVVYPSSLSILSTFCCRCFRELPSMEQPLLPCLSCHSAFFCSAKCSSLSHPKLLCHALPALLSNNVYAGGHEEEDLLFLLSAYSLPSDKFLLLLSLHSNSSFLDDESINILHSKIALLLPADSTVPGRHFSIENTSSLISLEKNKSFTLLRPVDPEHKLVLPKPRAYGVYLWASMLNHDCMPNACGFHYLDDPIANDHKENNNTDVVFRALHEIEEGREVCISYVGAAGGYRRRQKRLMEDYGFECTCERCKIESQRDNGEEESEGEEEEEETEDHEIELYSTEEEEEEEEEMSDRISDGSNSLIGDYIERYVCSCGGFLAPLPPSEDGAVSDLKECNGCRDVVSNSYLHDSGREDEDNIIE